MILLLACSGTTIDNDVVEGLPGIDELAGVLARGLLAPYAHTHTYIYVYPPYGDKSEGNIPLL